MQKSKNLKLGDYVRNINVNHLISKIVKYNKEEIVLENGYGFNDDSNIEIWVPLLNELVWDGEHKELIVVTNIEIDRMRYPVIDHNNILIYGFRINGKDKFCTNLSRCEPFFGDRPSWLK